MVNDQDGQWYTAPEQITKLACGRHSISAESEAFSESGWSSEKTTGEAQEKGSEKTALKEVKEGASHPAIENAGQMAKRLIGDH